MTVVADVDSYQRIESADSAAELGRRNCSRHAVTMTTVSSIATAAARSTATLNSLLPAGQPVRSTVVH